MRGIDPRWLGLPGCLLLIGAVPARPHLFIGTVEACRDRVLRAEIDTDAYSGAPVLRIAFDAHGRADIAALTQRMVNRQITIRFGRRIISQPRVMEPILGGEVEINAAANVDLDAMRQAAMRSC